MCEFLLLNSCFLWVISSHWPLLKKNSLFTAKLHVVCLHEYKFDITVKFTFILWFGIGFPVYSMYVCLLKINKKKLLNNVYVSIKQTATHNLPKHGVTYAFLFNQLKLQYSVDFQHESSVIHWQESSQSRIIWQWLDHCLIYILGLWGLTFCKIFDELLIKIIKMG